MSRFLTSLVRFLLNHKLAISYLENNIIKLLKNAFSRIFMVTMQTSTKTSTHYTKYKILGKFMTFGATWLNTHDSPGLNRVNVYICRKAFFVFWWSGI